MAPEVKLLIALKDRKSWERASGRLRLPPGAEILIAPLTEDRAFLEEVVSRTQALGCRSRVLESSTDYRDVCLRARDKWMAFMAKWPAQFRRGSRDFRELFVERDELSWWWLSELSQRNCEDRPTFGWLCELELLRDLAGSEQCDQAVLCVENVDVYDVMRSWLEARGTGCIPNRGRRPLRDRNRTFWVWLMRWRDFFGELSHTLAVKWACRGHGFPQASSGRRSVVWHTWYPSQWLKTNDKREDRYYLNIPESAEAGGRFHSSYLATIRGPLAPWSVLRAIRQQPLSGDFDYVQRYARVRDLFWHFFDLRPAFRFWALDRFDRGYRESFVADGVDLFPVLQHDMRFSYLRNIPRLLATADQFRHYASRCQSDLFVSYLELYCYGRAVIYGIKSGSPQTQVIGYQHSAVTPMKMVYNYCPGQLRMGQNDGRRWLDSLPLPDRFVAHGSASERILAAGGYPQERIDVTGIVRTDYLYRRMKEPPEACPEVPAGSKVVLVASPIWPDRTARLVETAIRGLKDRAGLFAIFKLHPLDTFGKHRIDELAGRYAFKDYRVWNADLYKLIRMASAIFTMSSTTGAEAIAMGVPVIHLQSPRDLDLSPFFEMPEAAFQVSDAEGFRSALDAILHGAPELVEKQAKWGDFIAQTFCAVDGQSGERFLQALWRAAGDDGNDTAGISRSPLQRETAAVS